MGAYSLLLKILFLSSCQTGVFVTIEIDADCEASTQMGRGAEGTKREFQIGTHLRGEHHASLS